MPRRAWAIAGILSGTTLVVLDGAIANVALPTISHTLNVSPAASVWVVTGYQMALVVALLPCSAIGESLGYKRVFKAGVILFTLASALCAFAPSLPVLVAARFLQGLGGAAVMALLAALLRFTFPHRLLGAAIAANALTVALSSAAGPTIGSAILSVASWPWLFAVNIPIGIAVVIATRALPVTPGTGRRLDLVSVLLNAGFFAPLVVGVDMLTDRPATAIALLVFGAICLAALIRREMPRKAPLIPLDLLRSASFRISVMASVCCFAAQMLSYVALPFYFQHGLGLSTFTTGLYMTPWPLAVAVAAPSSSRLSSRVPTAWLCAGGGVALAAGVGLASIWPLGGGPAPIIAFTILAGLGFGFFQTPNNRNMLLSAPRERSGAAGGMQGTARLVGQTGGAVIMALLFSVLPLEAAPRIGLAVAAVMALAAGGISLLRSGR